MTLTLPTASRERLAGFIVAHAGMGSFDSARPSLQRSCSAPTATGVQRIPVSIDASPFEAFTVSVDEQEKEVVN